MTLRLSFVVMALAFATMGCSSETTSGSRGVSCIVVETRAIGPDDETPLGTANGVVAGITLMQHANLRWFSNRETQTTGDTTLTVEVLPDTTSVTYETRKAEDVAQAALCGDVMNVSAALLFKTADGTFDERFSGTLHKGMGISADFVGTLPASELQGSYDHSWLPPSHAGELYSLRTALSPNLSGTMYVDGPEASSSPNVTYGSAYIAEWPAGP
jgi:hypothetical protein